VGFPDKTQSLNGPRLWRDALRIFFVSMALMMFEINLVRIFSVVMYFHLAFFVLAIALFGVGLGGLYGQMLRRRLVRTGGSRAFADYLPILLGVGVLLALAVLLVLPLGTERVDYQVPRLRWLLCVFMTAAMPFFLGSLFISLIFATRTQEASRLYFSDLMGASAGCLLAVPALEVLGGTTTPCLIALVSVLPALLGSGGPRRRRRVMAAAMVALAATALGALNLKWEFLSVRGSTLLSSRPLFVKWNFFSRIAVQDDPGYRGWNLSSYYDGPIPRHLIVTQDGRAPAFIVHFDGDYDEVRYLRHDLTSVPYRIFQPKEILLIGVGGGRDILTAKLYGVQRVQGVELNPITANDVMRGQFRKFSGDVYDLGGVSVAVDNGRTFVERDDNLYDLLFCSLVDTQVGSAQGAYVLSENYLYTEEAYEAYLDRLKPGGACATIGRSDLGLGVFLLRQTCTAIAALEAKSVSEPGRHLLVVVAPPEGGSVWMGYCIMWTRSPVTEETVSRARQACADLGFELAWPNAAGPSRWADSIARLLDPQTRNDFLSAAQNDLRPLVDDRPYLFYITKPRDFLSLLIRPSGQRVATRSGVAAHSFYLLTDLFVVALIGVFALMLSPLILLRRRELGRGGRAQLTYLLFFFSLGIAYMLVEVSLLQQFFLFLGNPTLTFAVTLCAMLAFTGLGSLISKRFPSEALAARLAKVAGVAVAIQLCVWLFLPRLIAACQGSAIGAKSVLVIAVLAVVATPMGMLFPSGIRLVGRSGLEMTCWVWGMNGLGSVLGSVGSAMLSMNLGVSATFLAGTLCYCVVLALSFFLRERGAMGTA